MAQGVVLSHEPNQRLLKLTYLIPEVVETRFSQTLRQKMTIANAVFVYVDQNLQELAIRYLALSISEAGERKVHFGTIPCDTPEESVKELLPAQGEWTVDENNILTIHFNAKPDAYAIPHTFIPIGQDLYRCSKQRNLMLPFQRHHPTMIQELHLTLSLAPGSDFELRRGLSFRYFHAFRYECVLELQPGGEVRFHDARKAPEPQPQGSWEIANQSIQVTFGKRSRKHYFIICSDVSKLFHGKYSGSTRILIPLP